MRPLKVIALSIFVLLEVFAVRTLFHAALYNNLPTDVARAAWGLGVCVIALTVTILVLEIQNRPDQSIKRSMGNK